MSEEQKPKPPGAPLSIKTAKQGRRESLRSILRDDPFNMTKDSRNGRLKKRCYRRDGAGVVLSNCRRIIRFPRSTEKERAAAQLYIETFEQGKSIHFKFTALIQGITRKLSRMYKDF